MSVFRCIKVSWNENTLNAWIRKDKTVRKLLNCALLVGFIPHSTETLQFSLFDEKQTYHPDTKIENLPPVVSCKVDKDGVQPHHKLCFTELDWKTLREDLQGHPEDIDTLMNLSIWSGLLPYKIVTQMLLNPKSFGFETENVPKEDINANWWKKQMAGQNRGIAQLGYAFWAYHTKRDEREAATYFRLAADNGEPRGMACYATMLSTGCGVERDASMAQKYAKMAADATYPSEQEGRQVPFNYGSRLYVDIGVGLNREAARYFKMAADQGYAKAQFGYGCMLFNGRGVPCDCREAARYFKMAADQGHPEGMFNYGCVLFRGDGVDLDRREAARYFKMAAYQGLAEGQFNYGCVLFHGEGVPRDCSEAARCFKMAAGQGHAKGMFNYGCVLFRGDGVPRDCREAARYFKMAAYQGLAEGMFNYGCVLFRGDGVDLDRREAARYFKMAADQGHPEAIVCYGSMLSEGVDVVRDTFAGANCFREAAERGSALGKLCYGYILLLGIPPFERKRMEAARYYREVTESYPYAHSLFAESEYHFKILCSDEPCEFFGEFNSERRLLSAANHVLTSLNRFSKERYDYRKFLQNSCRMNSRNERVWSFIKSEADSGLPRSQYLYGCYLKDHDYKGALEYFRMGANQHCPEAAFAYAAMLWYEDKHDNLAEIRKFFHRAAQSELMIAKYHYGKFLLETYKSTLRTDDIRVAAHQLTEVSAFSFFPEYVKSLPDHVELAVQPCDARIDISLEPMFTIENSHDWSNR